MNGIYEDLNCCEEEKESGYRYCLIKGGEFAWGEREDHPLSCIHREYHGRSYSKEYFKDNTWKVAFRVPMEFIS